MSRFRGTGHRIVLGAVILGLWLLAPPTLSRSEAPHIERIILSDIDEYLVVYFRLEDAFLSDELNQVIQAGLKTTFTYQAELQIVRAVLPAQTLAAAELIKELRYDPLSGRYAVKSMGRGGTTATTTSLVLAQHLMTEVSDLRLTPINVLRKGETYRVRLRAVIHKPKAPPNFKYKIIIPPRDLVTEWYEIEIER